MTKLQWFFLWLLFICYLFMGATIFYFLESNLEAKRRQQQDKQRDQVHDLLQYHFAKDSSYARSIILSTLSDYCEKPFSRTTEVINGTTVRVGEELPWIWTYYNSFFFCLTAVSTIGYGNISPSSDDGRLILIFYSLIGVPFCGIVMSQLGVYFGSVFLRAHHRYKNHIYETCMPLMLDIILYLVPGLLIIIIVPAVMFAHFEDWTIITSIYYAFVTLTTIGFGDFVAGQRNEGKPTGYGVYKIVLIIWVMFGLGYLVMVIGFIAKGLRSKKVHKLEHKLANTIKQTRSKIWNEFVTDLTQVRRVLNEIYLLKVKPVYIEKERLNLGRSQSCPSFDKWPMPKSHLEEDEETSEEEGYDNKRVPRRRAYSEHVPNTKMVRGLSESHLDTIDRGATFAASTHTIDSREILATFVTAMRRHSCIDQYPNGGVNCFSDEDILASEDWALGRAGVQRGRAYSCVVNPQGMGGLLPTGYPEQKTWSGTDSLRQIMLANIRKSTPDIQPEMDEKPYEANGTVTSSSSSLRRMSIAAMNFISNNSITQRLRRKSTKDIEQGEDTKSNNVQSFEIPSRGKRLSLPEVQPPLTMLNDNFHRYGRERRPSLVDAFLGMNRDKTVNGISPVLEQTSVADFIRLLSSMESLREEEEERHLATQPAAERRKSVSAYGLAPRQESKRRFSYAVERQPPLQHKRVTALQQRQSLTPLPIVEERSGSTNLLKPPLQHQLTLPLEPPVQRQRRSNALRPSFKLGPPTLVVTSPDGSHTFSVHTTPTSEMEQPFHQ